LAAELQPVRRVQPRLLLRVLVPQALHEGLVLALERLDLGGAQGLLLLQELLAARDVFFVALLPGVDLLVGAHELALGVVEPGLEALLALDAALLVVLQRLDLLPGGDELALDLEEPLIEVAPRPLELARLVAGVEDLALLAVEGVAEIEDLLVLLVDDLA